METMKDMLVDQFRMSRRMGDTRGFEEYKYTNEIIEEALKKIVPTTKMSDVERIEQFKLKGE
jgi:hypothetical protein